MTAAVSPRPATATDGGTLYLIFTQIASRLFTFIGNQFLLQYLSPALLGLAVQLELLSVTILYFARESFRVALQRQSPDKTSARVSASGSQRTINLAYLAVIVGFGAAVGLVRGYLRKSSDEVLSSVNFKISLQLYALATFIELIIEPCFAIVQQHSLFRVRARAETTAALSRCTTACVAAIVMHTRQLPASVLPSAIGQLSYAVVLFATYWIEVWSRSKAENFSVLPRKIKIVDDSIRKEYWLDLFYKPLLSLTVTFYAQSVFKLLLTQGDSLILSFLSDLKTQGAFALAFNYGGLLSRLILQPVEESSRNVFGRLLSSLDTQTSQSQSIASSTPSKSSATGVTQNQNTSKNTLPSKSPQSTSSNSLDVALTHLTTTLHLYTLISLPLLALLPSLLPVLTSFVLSPQWRTASTTILLQAYMYYLPFIAVNGVLDAFVTSVATPAQLRTQSLLMAGVTVIYGGAAWLLIARSGTAMMARRSLGLEGEFGSEGLVYANTINMALRIIYSVVFISSWVGTSVNVKGLWARCFPKPGCVVVAIAVGVGLNRSIGSNDGKVFLGIGGLSVEDVGCVLGGVVVLGVTIIVFEHRFLIDLVMPFIPKRLADQISSYLPKATMKQE